ncbi:uracil-DNA glycosylase family protein [Aquimarina sp. U1-2]|uniref:uracil-DNA glycosylase family protein n=1 Tax=Aquimarina sp. U1-2 TaxID=2823141 RepID=UPI001AEC8AB0|nr:uracil-DNA glycosylase family protein [Aquimarina sp. U1-2]MBP2831204.1 uracil-DNA glycosylase family protein [Aquimarina sp. U1-2]
MQQLLLDIKSCRVCKQHLPLGPRPIVSAHSKTKIALVSQAPGRIAHLSGVPWDDPGGKELKKWLGVSDAIFYNPENFAITPIGFCYPGKGKSGDLPPRPECAPLWHHELFEKMPELELMLLVGRYAQNYYLKKHAKKTLTETVKAYQEYLPRFLPLPHPSPRNRIWRTKNTWFEQDVVPVLQEKVNEILKLS